MESVQPHRMRKATFMKICREEGVMGDSAEYLWEIISVNPHSIQDDDPTSIEWVRKIAKDILVLWRN